MKLAYKNGATSVILRVFIPDSSVSTGAGKTGLAFNTSGLIISTIADNEATATTYTVAGSTIETITTLGTYAAPTATKCRFKEIDATNHPGLYEIQLADARFAVANARSLIVSVLGAANAAQVFAEVQLEPVPANATQWLGTAVATPDTAGHPKVTIKSGTGTGEVSLSSGIAGASLSAAERNSAADAILARTDGVETGITPQQALRAIAAMLAGIISGGGTGTEVFKAIGAAAGGTTRVTVTVDASGNRSAMTLNL